jgi:hypothetical protein
MKNLEAKVLTFIIRTVLAACFIFLSVFVSCKKDEPEPVPVVKKLDCSVGLQNKNELVYTATLSNVKGSKLVINRDGKLVFSVEINDVATNRPDYQMTFKYASDDPTFKNFTKGKYEFILTSNEFASDKLENKASIVIPNYLPSVNLLQLDLNSLNFMANMETSTSLVKEVFHDDNPEDNPVSATGVKSVDGKTMPTLKTTATGYDLNVKSLPGVIGSYQIELEFGSTEGGLEQSVLQGQIAKDTRINYLAAPNDSTLNFYGSGDANNNNTVDTQDLARLIEVSNGSFFDPNDKRLRDRCDINGDTYINLLDVQILQDKLNGVIAYLPGEWNKLPSREAKEDWAKKMFAIDKTNEIIPNSGWDCNQFTDQTYINFHGISLIDIPKFLQIYSYDLTNNGRFNLPLLEVITQENDATGNFIYGHALNAFLFANPSIFGNICPFEPQRDHMNIQFGEDFLIGINSEFLIYGPPLSGVATLHDGSKMIVMEWYVKYDVKDKIPSLRWMDPNLITK